jgi:hypothetical protein
MTTKGLEETLEDQEEIDTFLEEVDQCWELWKAGRGNNEENHKP